MANTHTDALYYIFTQRQRAPMVEQRLVQIRENIITSSRAPFAHAWQFDDKFAATHRAQQEPPAPYFSNGHTPQAAINRCRVLKDSDRIFAPLGFGKHAANSICCGVKSESALAHTAVLAYTIFKGTAFGTVKGHYVWCSLFSAARDRFKANSFP